MTENAKYFARGRSSIITTPFHKKPIRLLNVRTGCPGLRRKWRWRLSANEPTLIAHNFQWNPLAVYPTASPRKRSDRRILAGSCNNACSWQRSVERKAQTSRSTPWSLLGRCSSRQLAASSRLGTPLSLALSAPSRCHEGSSRHCSGRRQWQCDLASHAGGSHWTLTTKP